MLLFAYLVIFPFPAFAGQAVLSWSPSSAPDLAGYVVYYKDNSNALPLTKTQYTQKFSLPGTQVRFTKPNLDAGLHSFAVTAFDYASNESALSVVVKKTILVVDVLPPVLSSVSEANFGSNSAQITWLSDEPATSEVRYGLSPTYGLSSGFSASLTLNHSRTLTNLQAETRYYYEVVSRDVANNVSTRSGEFVTLPGVSGPDTMAPLIQSISVDGVKKRSVGISWQTNEPSSAQVEYRRSSDSPSETLMTTLNDASSYSHTVILTFLEPETSYDFQVISIDAAGNSVRSETLSFQTEALAGAFLDRTAPADPNGFFAEIGDGQATLSWDNPSDSDFVGVRVRYRTDRFPTDINDGMLLAEVEGAPNAHSEIRHTGLENDITYYYLASSYDGSGNYQAPLFASATPRAPSNTSSSGGGGCGLITTQGGGPPSQPGDAAALLSVIGALSLLLIKKRFKPIRLPVQ